MYHQMMVAKNDEVPLRFVWRDNTDKEVVGHMMKVHIFGKIDSPCIASWVIKRTPSDQSSQYENEIIETIKQSFYMSDSLDCFASEAIETVHKVIRILSTGDSKVNAKL